MAESTGDSVGKISLDLEVTSDLSNQISKVSNTIGKKLKDTMDNATKSMFDGMSENMDKNMQSMNSSLKSGLDKMKQNIRSTFTSALDVLKNIKMPSISFPKMDIAKPNASNAISQPVTRGPPKATGFNSEAIKAQMDNVAKTLDNTNAEIEQQQAKLAGLKQSYNMAFNETSKNKIQEQILKTESAINSLISKSDKLGFKLADLDEKLAMAGKGAGEAASKINSLSKSTGIFESLANGAANITKKLNESLKSLGSTSNSTNNHMNNMNRGLSNIAKQFFTWMVVLPLVMKGLSSMTSFLGSALMTNTQFANSLNQIKSNLYTAFMPIYNAILPALNSLMSSLATATAYMASFISQLFGSTYEASFGAAKNLQASIGAYDQQEKAAKKAATALGGAGSAAKKAGQDAKSGLMGFDEINKLSDKTPTPAGSGVETPITPMANMAPIESKTAEWVQKFKDIMSKIFDPMKEAWANEGKATMDALKYALSSIWDLAKDIGKTFLDVWDNGTGIRICTDILKLLQTIFGIIGDIATAFKTAWDKGDLGKQVVQTLFNAFDAILNILIDIGNTFRDVWNSGLGIEICTNILEILKNIFTIIGQVATSFKNAWDSGLGKQLVTDILNLLNGCLRVIKDITGSFSKAWETNGDTICTGILLILDDIIGTVSDIANKWANAWESNGAGDTLMNSLLNTLGKLLITIGDIGQGMRESIGKAADIIFPALIQFATNVSNGLGNIADGFKLIWDNGGKHLLDGIVQLIAKAAELALKLSGPAFEDFSTLFKDVLAPAIGPVCDVLGTLIDQIIKLYDWVSQSPAKIGVFKDVLTNLVLNTFPGLKGAIDLIKLFEPISTNLGEVKQNIVTTWGNLKTTMSTKWDEIKADAATKWETIKQTLSDKWGDITTKSSTTWGDIKTYIGQKWSEINQDAPGLWDTIKTTLSGKWSEITTSSSTTWDGIKTYMATKWGEVNSDAPGLWSTIGTTLSTAWNGISTDSQGIWNGIVTFLNTTFSTNWGKAWNDLSGLVSKAFDGLENIVKKPINAIIKMANYLIEKLNSISIDIPDSKIFGDAAGTSFGIHIPTIPALATGGIIDSPTLAMVGEAGKEAVMPLENNTGWITELAGKIAGIMGANSNSVSTSSNDSGDIIFMLDGNILGKVALSQLRKMKKQGIILSDII